MRIGTVLKLLGHKVEGEDVSADGRRLFLHGLGGVAARSEAAH